MNKTLAIICAVCLGTPFILSFKARNPRKFRRYSIAIGFCILLVASLFIPKDPNFIVQAKWGQPLEDNSATEQKSEKEQGVCTWNYTSDIDLSMYSVISVAESSATNFKQTKSNQYPSQNLFDGDADTCWQDGVEGNGEGTVFSVTLAEPSNVQYIVIQNGRARSDEKFVQNGRIWQMQISNGSVMETVELPDENTPIVIKVNGWENVSNVSFHIMSVYPGSEYQDTCVSEITFYR